MQDKDDRMKKLAFRIILYLPSVFLFLILFNFGFNILRLNYFDYEGTYSKLRGLSSDNDGFKEDIMVTEESIQFYNYNSAGYESPGLKTFNYTNSNSLIFVYGASSVVAPQYNEVFSKYLENKLNEKNKVKVINFGMDAMISDSIKGRIKSSLKNKTKPELIIFYAGHNDYN
ncbi:MAG: hypothetical protein JSW18_04675, partial [Candidatus Omnitrophota bacterium]